MAPSHRTRRPRTRALRGGGTPRTDGLDDPPRLDAAPRRGSVRAATLRVLARVGSRREAELQALTARDDRQHGAAMPLELRRADPVDARQFRERLRLPFAD